jgi:hypothetical protein
MRALAVLAMLATGSSAWACSEGRTVYVFDNANASWATYGDDANPNGPMSAEHIKRSIRFLPEEKLELTENGKKTILVTEGIATGFAWRMASKPGSEDEQDTHRYRVFDLSKIARKGAPRQVMVFDDDLFWPNCR